MKIGFIGAGNMATAIIGGLVRADYNKKDIIVYDVFEEKLKEFGNMGLTVSDSSVSLAKDADIIVLAVKPQQYGEVLEGIASVATMEKTFVSIAAGITVEYVRRKLMINAPVVRVMPNTPLLLGKGATAISPSENVKDEVFEVVKSMFENSGVVEILPESQMNAVISVNGSSPAYIYLFAKAVCILCSFFKLFDRKVFWCCTHTKIFGTKIYCICAVSKSELKSLHIPRRR